MKLSRLFAIAAVTSVAGLIACSSDDESTGSGSQASTCAEAKKNAEACSSKTDGGSVTVTFDQAKCESGGDQAKKAADCINTNKSNCDCLIKCQLSGSCS